MVVVLLFTLFYAIALILLPDPFLLCEDNMHAFSQIPPKWGILENVNLPLLKGAFLVDGFLQVFFKEFTVVGSLKS